MSCRQRAVRAVPLPVSPKAYETDGSVHRDDPADILKTRALERASPKSWLQRDLVATCLGSGSGALYDAPHFVKDENAKQEIELKRLLLGEGAAEALIAALGEVSAQRRQVNHVLDTEGYRLREERYSVRLRFEDGAPILTAKGPGKRIGGDTSTRDEAEARIDDALASAILSGHRDPVDVLRERAGDEAFGSLWQGLVQARRGLPLREVGSFENQRRIVPVRLPSGLDLHVEVDRTCFPDGHIDEEVEIELPSGEFVAEVETWLAQQALEAGVVMGPSSPKLARFYAHRGDRSG
ncbi:MAG TPA: CYTH domain-containing protein [Polyangiaceae bacterium]